MEVCFRSSMEAGVVEYSTKGTDVICIGAECQFCEKGMEPLEKETPGYEKLLVHPAVCTTFPSTWDLSAHKTAVVCKKSSSFCLFCNCNLEEHSYMDFLSKDGLRLEALHGQTWNE